MPTPPVSGSSVHQPLQTYFQARNADLQKLGQALQSGDLAAAQQEFQAIQNLGQSSPFAGETPFKNSAREQAFDAIGKTLQSGDLAGAQRAFAQLKSSFQHAHRVTSPQQDLGGPFTPVVSAAGQPEAGSAPASAPASVDVTA